MVIHEFVVMPDHVHLLITLPGALSVQKAMQLIKGRFSFRAGRSLGFGGEVWQRGFSDVRILNEADYRLRKTYIEHNPVNAGLVSNPKLFPFGSLYLKGVAGAKALDSAVKDGTTEVVP